MKQRCEDYEADAKATWTDIKVAFPKSVPFRSSLVMITDKLLCIGSKVRHFMIFSFEFPNSGN